MTRRRLGQLPGRRKSGELQKPAAGAGSEGRRIEAISLKEDLGGLHLSGGGGYETVDEEVGDTPRLEEEGDDLFVDIGYPRCKK